MTESQESELMAAVCAHIREEVGPAVERLASAEEFPEDLWSAAATRKLTGLYAGRELSGSDAHCSEAAPIFEELGAVEPSYALGLSVHNVVVAALSAFNSPAANVWVRRLAAGEGLGGFLMTEASGGSDPAGGLATKAVRTATGYELTGTKTWATFAGVADVYVVLAEVVGRSGESEGPALFIVDGRAGGLRVEDTYSLPTGAFLRIGSVGFERVRLGEDAVLTSPGQGLRAALLSVNTARVHVAAAAVGVARAAVKTAAVHAHSRRLFGQRSLELQGNSFALADVETSILAGRLLYRNAAQKATDRSGTAAVAHAKRFATDAAVEAAAVAARVMGADGLRTESGMPALAAAAHSLLMADGAPNVLRLIIARGLAPVST